MGRHSRSSDNSPSDFSIDKNLRLQQSYRRVCRLAERGKVAAARARLTMCGERAADPRVKALIQSDLAALAAYGGDHVEAHHGFLTALGLDPDCQAARLNLAVLEADMGALPASQTRPPKDLIASRPGGDSVRVAILSFLFNWPSTGGGIVHTVELAQFLQAVGYEVQHVFARFEPWGIGQVSQSLPYSNVALEFDESNWNVPAIQAAYRSAVEAFDPDTVIITDSWNSKPLLAEAVREYPFILRLQALECLCPLNNVRLLAAGPGGLRQCPTHQFASDRDCYECLTQYGDHSGALHRAERELCGVGSSAYREVLLRAFRDAEAVLVVNPLTEAMVSPYAKVVRTVTAGMDPHRFPWPWTSKPTAGRPEDGRAMLLFAGLASEPIKGFRVLHEAGSILWQRRQDFELVVTDDPPGRVDAFTRYVGWQTQEDLPQFLRAADILVMPTIAQEALGRTAVEAMAAGRPVVASRLGGLPFTVVDGATGLLCEPGDPADLARKLERLLDDPLLRERLGTAGRQRFDEHYAWPVIIDRHYRPLLKPRHRSIRSARTVAGESTPETVRFFTPYIPLEVDQQKLVDDIAQFLGQDPAEVERLRTRYLELHTARRYAETLGELKTLCFEETFLFAVLLASVRPRLIAEVGVSEGKSTRRILDLVTWLGLEAQTIGFDVADTRRYVSSTEHEMVVGDLTGRFGEQVLDRYRPDLVILDVHSYPLLKEAITTCLTSPTALVIHDCGTGLCNPQMMLSRESQAVSSATGVWERHILAELFEVADPLSAQLDTAATTSHRLRVFDTPHGLAMIVPASMTFSPSDLKPSAAPDE